jgi:SAM-dependent methyltransferase
VVVDRSDERYTHGHHESVLRSHAWRTVENSAAYLVPQLVPGASVLDLGCGPGTITVDLARRVAPGLVIGLDAADEVVDRAAAGAREAGVDNVQFVVGDAYSLDYPDGAFDVVHAHQLLQHVADPVAVLREMRRVARSTGVVAVREVDYAGIIWYPLIPGLAKWLALYERVHRSNGGEPDAGRRLKAWALEAGFSRVQSTASVWCFASDEDRQWWGSMWETRVLQSAFAADAVGKGLATQAELEEIAAAWRQWADAPEGWLLMPHGEVLCREV